MNSAPQDAGQILLPLARQSITHALRGQSAKTMAAEPWLSAPGACLVSLTLDGKPRGQSLSHEPSRPLGEDVIANAATAALRDPLHAPLTAAELSAVSLQVALFAQWTRVKPANEAQMIAALRPGEDAVFFRYGRHRSMFMPAQWAEYPDSAVFIAHLKYRAGLPPDFWDAGVELARSQVLSWKE